MDKKKFMLDILDLVLNVNGGIAARSGKGHPTGLIRYSGHTNTLYVYIHPDGWYWDEKTNVSKWDEFEFDFDHPADELEAEYDRLNRYIDELKLKEDEHVNVVPFE